MLTELLRIALGNQSSLPRPLTRDEWVSLQDEAARQCISALLYTGVERLPQSQQPPVDILFPWAGLKVQAEDEGRRMGETVREVVNHLRADGMHPMILKGQTMAALWDNPLVRACGDIDVLLLDARERVVEYARRINPEASVLYHEIKVPLHPQVEVELHLTPLVLSDPFDNRRLQHWFKGMLADVRRASTSTDGTNGVNIGDVAMPLHFNRFYILAHLYRHFLGHGIAMRQFIDYYYVLRQGFTSDERRETMAAFGRIGMTRFVRGTMWIMSETFGLADEYLLCTPDPEEGRYILRETMLTGNCGRTDSRATGLTGGNALTRFVNRQRYKYRHLGHYTSEVIWDTVFDVRLWIKNK